MKNIKYISASAGSGKTYTLTEELKNAVSGKDEKGNKYEKIEPEKIILTTFTKAATSEILEKAKAKLFKEGLTEEAEKLDQAAIGTIDSICENFARKYWYVLGISPNPNVMTDDAKDFFVNQSLLDLADDDECEFLADFADEFGINYDFWKDDLKRIIDFSQNYGIKNYEESKKYSKIIVGKIKQPCHHLKVRKDLVEDFLNKVEEINDLDSIDKKNEVKSQIYNQRKKIKSEDENSLAYAKSVLNFTNGLPKKTKIWKNIPLRDEVASSLSALYSTEEVCAEIEKYIDTIFALAERWQDKYENYKKTHHLLDFIDMETKMFSLLENPEVQNDIKANYKYIFVDEAQDCSPLQVKIFNKLSDLVEKSIWVGDTKQAIYGFRGSDTDLADAVVKIIKNKKENHEAGFETSTLDTSYRSLRNIVSATNATFTKAFIDLPKNEVELKCNRKDKDNEPDGFIRYWVLTDGKAEERTEQIAKNIVLLIENGEKPKDIALLARSNSDLRNVAKTLKKYKVPVFRAKDEANTDLDSKTSAIITLVTSLLTLLVDQTDEYAKAKIKHLTEKGATLGAIIDEKLKSNGSLAVAFTGIYETQLSKELLEKKEYFIHQPLKNLVESVIIELDLYNKANEIISSDYEETSEILHAIIDSAEAYEENSSLLGKTTTLNGFISYLNEKGISVSGNKNGVQLFTFHGSKGLEWKNVILMSLDNDFLNEDKLIKHEIFGVHRIYKEKPSEKKLFPTPIISVFPDLFGKSKLADEIKTSLENDEVYSTAKSKTIEEEKRLMYVAMTRPRDNLIFALNGYMSKKDKENPPEHSKGLKYIENLGFGTIQILPQTPGEKCDLFNSGFLSEFEKNADENDVPKNYSFKDKSNEVFWPNKLKSKKDKNLLPRNINPSKLKDEKTNDNNGTSVELAETKSANFSFEKTTLSSKINISGNPNKTELGTFLHNIFCVVQHKTDEELSKIIADSEFEKNLKNPCEIKFAWNDFTKYLEKNFGKAEKMLHEYPFEFLTETNQIAKGRMDFIWQTKNGSVIVDYKTYFENNDIFDKTNESCAGKYQAQLDLYEKVLKSAGENIIAKILWYPCLGIVVRLDL